MSQPIETLVAGRSVELRGRGDRVVAGGQPLELAGPDDMAFHVGRSVAPAAKSAAGVVFLSPADADALGPPGDGRTYVVSADPKNQFFDALTRLRPRRPRSTIGQSPHAFIHPNAQIGPRTNVHPGASVGSGAVIGARCEIGPGVHVGPGCRIGDDVRLDPHVVLYHDVIIGDRVSIQAGSVIGADGFGYSTRGGRHERIPHFGIVRIEDDVDIGANTTIDRAVLGETVIGTGSKLDNLVVIAHNCRIGRHNLMVSQVGLAGSVTTGDYVVCAGQVGIADHVHIGTGAILGAKSGIHKDMPGGQTYLGTPAAPAEETFRSVMALQKLPQMRKTLRDLEKQVAELTARLQADDAKPRVAA